MLETKDLEQIRAAVKDVIVTEVPGIVGPLLEASEHRTVGRINREIADLSEQITLVMAEIERARARERIRA